MHPHLIESTQRLLQSALGLHHQIEVIDRSGSDRCFYRVNANGSGPLIVMQYGLARNENTRYVSISRFLNDLGLRTPTISAWDPEKRLVWMEDLGVKSLWSVRTASWPERRRYYLEVIQQIRPLHTAGIERAKTQGLTLEKSFDLRLYQWEQNYFFDNCLLRHFNLPAEQVEVLRSLPILHEAPRRLVDGHTALVHRDLQSQNILLKEEEVIFIDFQGLRVGHPLYDLASLLLDPYVSLAPTEQRELEAAYCEATAYPTEAFQIDYLCCGLQRLMQALGAYGFLGHEKGKSEFLAYVPPALSQLTNITSKIPGLKPLHQTLRSLQQ